MRTENIKQANTLNGRNKSKSKSKSREIGGNGSDFRPRARFGLVRFCSVCSGFVKLGLEFGSVQFFRTSGQRLMVHDWTLLSASPVPVLYYDAVCLLSSLCFLAIDHRSIDRRHVVLLSLLPFLLFVCCVLCVVCLHWYR